MDNARPFAGIEVVEFGQFIAVPFCAQVLSEGGANVVKVESVEGDPVRQLAPLTPGETRHFVSRNRGKRSLPLDLHHPSAARVVERLVARAAVVLTNFRPGLAAELGLDWPTLAPRYPRLVVRIDSADGPVHHGLRAGLAEGRAAGRPHTELARLTPKSRTPARPNIYSRAYATRDAAIAVACGSASLRRAFIPALGLIDHAL